MSKRAAAARTAPVLGLTAATTQNNPHHFIVKQYFCEAHEGRIIPRPSVARSMMPHAKFIVYASYDESDLVIEQYYFLKQSTIPNAGLGLFAGRDFTPHETVAWYTGKEISKDIALDLAQFVNDFSRGTERGQNLYEEHRLVFERTQDELSLTVCQWFKHWCTLLSQTMQQTHKI